MKRLMALRQKRAEIKDQARAITGQAETLARDLTPDENTRLDAMIAQAETIEQDILREEKLADMDRRVPSASVNVATAGERAERDGGLIHVIERATLDGKAGFKSYGEFAGAVLRASINQSMDPRLVAAAAPATYGNENTGADGGFLVPTDFANAIRAHAFGQDSFIPMTDNNPVSGNGMTFPRDETTPWGSNGVRAYWEGEAGSATNTKPLVGTDTLRLRKLMALVPVTDELLADATALDNYISTKTGDSIRWKSNDALINGTGAGMPLGILNAAALVSVAKETSQTATTFNAANVAKMFARMPAESMSNAVWIINNDVFPQLIVMTIGDTPVWNPDMSGRSPAGLLLGRPIILSQSCKTLGTKGDVLFVDWKKYLTITKSTGVEMASSMHLYFEAGLTAFRATFRVDGQPWLKASITPANGSNNLSPFVSLDTRV